MFETNSNLLLKQCRTCLSDTCNTKMLEDTVLINGANMKLSKIIMECASVEITMEDTLPNIICGLCVDYASTSYKFRRKCEESDKILRLQIIKSEIENDDKLITKSTLERINMAEKSYSTAEISIHNSYVNANTTNQSSVSKADNELQDSDGCFEENDYNYTDTADDDMDIPLIALKREIDALPDDMKASFLSMPNDNDDYINDTLSTEYGCKKCNRIFLKGSAFRSHICLKYCKRRKCSECGLKFDNLSELQEHYTTHETFTCKRCNKSYSTLPQLKKHMKHQCKQVDFRRTCAICFNVFASNKRLQTHLKTHETIICKHCKKVFPKLLGLHQHLKRFHVQTNQPCEKKRCRVCHLEFDNADQLRGHYATHDSFPCKNCPKVFRTASSLRAHQQRTCIKSDQKACMVCNAKFQTNYQLLKHYGTEHEDYPCRTCGDRFDKVLDLRIHKQRKCRALEMNNQCVQCGLEFESAEMLRAHHKAHDQIQCPDCGRAFAVMRALRRHRATTRCQLPDQSAADQRQPQQRRRRFRCDLCTTAFATYAEHEAHRRTHTAAHRRCEYCAVRVHGAAMEAHVQRHETEGFQCAKCSDKYFKLDQWREHLATHMVHKCSECTKTFFDTNLLQKHILRHYFDSIQLPTANQCRECELSYDDRDVLFEHFITHSTFMCPICETSFDSLSQLRQHSIKRKCLKPKLPRTCDICQKVFRRAYAMRMHRLTHNSDNSNALCPHCDFQGERKSDLYQHMDSEHDNLKTIQCPDCDKRFFKKTNLMVHKLVHTGEKKHICDYCGVGFALGNNLKAHIRIHTGERPYKCKICDKSFIQHRSMVSHMDMHLPRQKHVCPICGKTYPRKQAMKLHMKRHNDERPFACTLCAKSFQTKLDLKRHTETHSGIRNHICSVCNKAFGRKNALNVHMMIHTGETPHVCDICGKGFIQAHCLRGHMKTHHGRV